MHLPSAHAFSRPRPLLHRPRALNPVMHTQLVSKYYLKTPSELFGGMVGIS